MSLLTVDLDGDDPFLRTKEVLKLVPVGRTTLHTMVREGRFPPPQKIGARAVAWKTSVINRWRDSRPDAREQQAA
jgi:prophage regulatory protein